MIRIMRNTLAVLVATMLTAAGVFGVVSAIDTGTTSATSGTLNESASGELQTCPCTGCSSYGCHATDGTSPGGHGGGRGRGL